MDQGEIEFELDLFRALRLSELDEQKCQRENLEKVNNLSNQVLDCLSATIVKRCPLCKNKLVCFHWYPEDLYIYWMLRGVCKKWKQLIDDWLRNNPIILQYGYIIPKTVEFYIIEDNWVIEEYPALVGKHYLPVSRSSKKPLCKSIKWWEFLAYCELVYQVKTNRSDVIAKFGAPICDKAEAEEKVKQMEAIRYKKQYRREVKQNRKNHKTLRKWNL